MKLLTWQWSISGQSSKSSQKKAKTIIICNLHFKTYYIVWEVYWKITRRKYVHFSKLVRIPYAIMAVMWEAMLYYVTFKFVWQKLSFPYIIFCEQSILFSIFYCHESQTFSFCRYKSLHQSNRCPRFIVYLSCQNFESLQVTCGFYCLPVIRVLNVWRNQFTCFLVFHVFLIFFFCLFFFFWQTQKNIFCSVHKAVKFLINLCYGTKMKNLLCSRPALLKLP